MSELLFGQSLTWASYDAAGITTIAVHTMLPGLCQLTPEPLEQASRGQRAQHSESTALSPHWIRLSTPHSAVDCPAETGLVLWQLASIQELAAVCESAESLRLKIPDAARLVVTAPGLARLTPILLESGAQIVVSQLTSLQNVLRHVVRKLPRARHGSHPLTTGLIHRLPWPEDRDWYE